MTEKIKKVLNYVGFIGAIITGVMYIALVLVMITGISQELRIEQAIVFLIITAAAMLMGIICLRVQGASLARKETENAAMIKEYAELTAKPDKRALGYWAANALTTLFDVVFKVLTVLVQIGGVIYLAMEGIWTWSLLLMALVNIMMTASFGMLSLNGQYDREQNKYIPWIKSRILKIKEEKALTSALTCDNIIIQNNGETDNDKK